MKTSEAQANAVEKRYVERLGQALIKLQRVVLPKSELFVSPLVTNEAFSDFIDRFKDLAERGYQAGFRMGAKAAVADLAKQGIPVKIAVESTGVFPQEFNEGVEKSMNAINAAIEAFATGIGTEADIKRVKMSVNATITNVIHRAWADAYLGVAQELKTYVHQNY